MNPSSLPQACGGCGKRILLLSGPAADPQRHPNPGGGDKISVKWANWFTYKSATSAPEGISSGNLDPVIGMAPLDSAGSYWQDIASIAVWRTINWFSLILASLILLPLGLVFVLAAFGPDSIHMLLVAAPFILLWAYAVYSTTVIRKQWMRVVGTTRTLKIRFDKPGRRRKKFYESVMRRAGIGEPPEIP